MPSCPLLKAPSALAALVCLWLTGLCLPWPQAQAATTPIAVAPVVVRLDPATDIAGVEVSNRGELPSGIEVEVMRVKWLNGAEQYEATTDFVVSPPAFRLQGGKSRMVRFKYAGQRSDAEGFYRLFLRQLPQEKVDNEISMVFNIGVPVFIAPLQARPALQLVGSASELRNTGNVTVTVLHLESKACAAPLKLVARVAPEQKLSLNADQLRCATHAHTDRGLLPLAAP